MEVGERDGRKWLALGEVPKLAKVLGVLSLGRWCLVGQPQLDEPLVGLRPGVVRLSRAPFFGFCVLLVVAWPTACNGAGGHAGSSGAHAGPRGEPGPLGDPPQSPSKRVLPSPRFGSATEKYSSASSPAFLPSWEGVSAMAVGRSSTKRRSHLLSKPPRRA